MSNLRAAVPVKLETAYTTASIPVRRRTAILLSVILSHYSTDISEAEPENLGGVSMR